jgi:hypothetical protein
MKKLLKILSTVCVISFLSACGNVQDETETLQPFATERTEEQDRELEIEISEITEEDVHSNTQQEIELQQLTTHTIQNVSFETPSNWIIDDSSESLLVEITLNDEFGDLLAFITAVPPVTRLGSIEDDITSNTNTFLFLNMLETHYNAQDLIHTRVEELEKYENTQIIMATYTAQLGTSTIPSTSFLVFGEEQTLMIHAHSYRFDEFDLYLIFDFVSSIQFLD